MRMTSALDLRMDEGIGKLTGDGAPMALTQVTVGGQTYPAIAAAPPSLAHYFAHYCAEHAEVTFLVSGDERLTFGEVYAQAVVVAGSLLEKNLAGGDRVGIAMRN